MNISPDTTTVAFIGTGIMGCPMAKHLIDAGYDLVVYNRTRSKASPLLDAGATWATDAHEAALQAQVIITMVGYPEEVEDLYLGTDGIIESAKSGSYLMDMSTSSPKLARELHAIGAVNDLHVLDCPVTGGDIGAREGRLTIFVGGEREDLDVVTPLLRCMGSAVSYQGIAGMGQMAKMANQIAMAGSLLGATEALAFAKQAGLDRQTLLEAMKGGTAGSFVLENVVPKSLVDDYSPGFLVKHFLKDMDIALSIADDMELTLPGLETAYQLFDLLEVVGGEDMGTQALALIYEDEDTCAKFGLDWSQADYEDYDDYDDDDDISGSGFGEQDQHHHRGYTGGAMGGFFSPN